MGALRLEDGQAAGGSCDGVEGANGCVTTGGGELDSPAAAAIWVDGEDEGASESADDGDEWVADLSGHEGDRWAVSFWAILSALRAAGEAPATAVEKLASLGESHLWRWAGVARLEEGLMRSSRAA